MASLIPVEGEILELFVPSTSSEVQILLGHQQVWLETDTGALWVWGTGGGWNNRAIQWCGGGVIGPCLFASAKEAKVLKPCLTRKTLDLRLQDTIVSYFKKIPISSVPLSKPWAEFKFDSNAIALDPPYDVKSNF